MWMGNSIMLPWRPFGTAALGHRFILWEFSLSRSVRSEPRYWPFGALSFAFPRGGATRGGPAPIVEVRVKIVMLGSFCNSFQEHGQSSVPRTCPGWPSSRLVGSQLGLLAFAGSAGPDRAGARDHRQQPLRYRSSCRRRHRPEEFQLEHSRHCRRFGIHPLEPRRKPLQCGRSLAATDDPGAPVARGSGS